MSTWGAISSVRPLPLPYLQLVDMPEGEETVDLVVVLQSAQNESCGLVVEVGFELYIETSKSLSLPSSISSVPETVLFSYRKHSARE